MVLLRLLVPGPVASTVVRAGPEARTPGRHETACERGESGAYLRREGLYSSLISEWRRLRDAGAGVLEGKDPGARVGRPSAEQAEIGRLRRELADREGRLATTETALEIMGIVWALFHVRREALTI